MQNLISFDYNTLTIRTQLTEQGEPLFCANDVCAALGYTNPRKAVSDHVALEDVTKRDTLTNGGNQLITYVNESGLYALIFGSNLESAKEFKRWVTSEVLPSIRKTGKYDATKQALPLLDQLDVASKVLSAVGITGARLALSLDHIVQVKTGESMLALAGVDLSQPNNAQPSNSQPNNAHLYTPTELGRMMTPPQSSHVVNKALEAASLQGRIAGKWLLTNLGKKAGGKGWGQLKWPASVLELI